MKQLDRFVNKIKSEIVNAVFMTPSACPKSQVISLFKASNPVIHGIFHNVNVSDLHDSISDEMYDLGITKLVVDFKQVTNHYRDIERELDPQTRKMFKTLGFEKNKALSELSEMEEKEKELFFEQYNSKVSDFLKLNRSCKDIDGEIVAPKGIGFIHEMKPKLPSSDCVGFMHHGLLEVVSWRKELLACLCDMWTVNSSASRNDVLVQCFIETKTRGYHITTDGRLYFNLRTISKESVVGKIKEHKIKVHEANRAARLESSDFSEDLKDMGIKSDHLAAHIKDVSELVNNKHAELFG